ncbi:MAG: FtsX-like permease family protein, partial [Lachnospiraceae bacterium]
MSLSLYPKLALHGIRKNSRFYTPYFLTCAGMIMMFYIIHYLAAMPLLDTMSGGTTTKQMLGLGTYIVALFALLYLFYSNSFLMRRRKKEFGLYNILGMSKANLGLVLFFETIMVAVSSFVSGLVSGILLSKLAEILLTKVLMGKVTYTFSICHEAVTDTLLIFLAIFVLVYLNGLRQILFSKTITLMNSETVGEKPPKANYLLGLGGAILLAVAYYMAVSIESPLTALTWFFVAVGMVIVATYLIFIAGSVMLCRILKNNKAYYYKKNHFVSVSSMAYRMKRNGAGLASVCILSTMVLVMMMATSCLYFGAEDSLNSRYPRDISVSLDYLSKSSQNNTYRQETEAIRFDINNLILEQGTEASNVEDYTYVQITGLLDKDNLILNPDDS